MTVTKKLIGRLPILLGEYDSTKTYSKRQRVTMYGSEFESIVDNNTTAPATLNNGTLVINTDNWRVVSNGSEAFLAGEKIKHFSENDNEEYIDAKTDANDRLLEGTKIDGSKYFSGDIDINGILKQRGEDVLSKKVDKESNKSLIAKDISDSLSSEENVEYSKILLDSENRILGGVTKNGTIVHNTEHKFNDTVNGKIADFEKGVFKSLTYNIPITEEKEVYIERPKFAELYINKQLPNTDVECIFKVDSIPILHCKADTEIQGHGSAAYIKKGYTFDFKNNNGEELKIKFGNMPALDSYHVKAYATDMNHCRCIGNLHLWKAMMAQLNYPDCLINNKSLNITAGQNIDSYSYADAQYCEDGFPIAIYLNNDFFGLYTIKTKKSMENYAMNKNDPNNIFLDSRTYTAFLHEPFDYTDWELKCPKLKGYEEGLDISQYNSKDGSIKGSDILAKINRLWGYLTTLSSETKTTANDYLILSHWITWLIFAEVTGQHDTNGNNMELLTWDATHWSISPYDTDNSIGLWADYPKILTTQSGMVTYAEFFKTFRTVFTDEIKAQYTKFRRSGLLDMGNIMKFYIEQCSAIPRSIYDKDYKKWGTIWKDKDGNVQIPTIKQIATYINSRIVYLDTQWLSNN